ncbi:hypothetical protein AU468_05645 [Alkalispirochaeta sphaeroplastigenens]|uniref:Uncharacterized protein n=1 Tax=Alkalispirochaeta sphaeroplastigenens TaxID=1187066 RepID=A0A2S4JU43_9SPIO|nr:1-propanol dehydrogenase PduQ [Alkalispirochaeta sphaeroplastigenens]POR03041.1 hypothetical protein AU468_05645 [Alkalispirochaeta sphaeroplastigenens]
MTTFTLGTKILSGPESLDYLRDLKADKVCVVTDTTMVALGITAMVTTLLDSEGVAYRVFDSVEADPSLETVQTGLTHIIETKPDAVIAVGGGSVIDAAKAIMYFCIKTKERLLHKTEIFKPHFVAIPTTSGTGSEVTSFSVVTDTGKQTKIALTDPLMVPDVAILDARFTMSVPPAVTADTGVDVITHAFEAYVSTAASTFSDILAQQALEISFHNLQQAFRDGQCREARQFMHEASCLAGIAFTNAGLGINHSLAHAVGGRFKISHGRTNAILLPLVIAFNSGALDGREEEFGQKYDRLTKIFRLDLPTRRERLRALVTLVQRFNQALEIPPSFGALGIQEDAFRQALPSMAAKALEDVCTGTNPRPVNVQELECLLEQAWQGL